MEKPNLIIYGRVIAVSNVQEIPSTEAGKAPMKKRQLYLDCTRYDSLTGERDEHENKPLLDFGGEKLCDKIGALNLQKDDVVMVRFAVQGVPTKDKATGKAKVFTAIKPYDVEVIRKAGEPMKPAAEAEAPAAPTPQPTNTGKEGLPL